MSDAALPAIDAAADALASAALRGVVLCNCDVCTNALGADAAQPGGLTFNALVTLARLACCNKALHVCVAQREPRLAALGAKQYALRVLPDILNQYNAFPMKAPTEAKLAAYMTALAARATAPPVAVDKPGTWTNLEPGESLRDRLAAAQLLHLAPQFAATEGAGWMAFVAFVRWCMNHPRFERAFYGTFNRAWVKVENHNMTMQDAEGVIIPLQQMYAAELSVCILNDVDHPCFFREIGWIGAEGDPRGVGLYDDSVYELMKHALDQYGAEELDVPGAGEFDDRADYDYEQEDELFGDPDAPLSEAQQRALDDLFGALGWQQQG